MLTIITPATETVEAFDDANQKFVTIEGQPSSILELEHSLVSLSKWEQKWRKPFLTQEEKTEEETISYVECMVLRQTPPSLSLPKLSHENLLAINDYLSDPRTATWINERTNRRGGASQTITFELIYYWLDAFEINWDAQYWHLNNLFMLLRVHEAQQQGGKKMSSTEAAAQQARINAQRLAATGSSG